MKKQSTQKRFLPLLLVMIFISMGYMSGILDYSSGSSAQAVDFVECTIGPKLSFSNAINLIIEMVRYSVLS